MYDGRNCYKENCLGKMRYIEPIGTENDEISDVVYVIQRYKCDTCGYTVDIPEPDEK